MTTEQAPRELTDAQIKKMASKFGVGNKPSPNFDFAWHDFARAAIAADRALVASQAQPAAEPRQDSVHSVESGGTTLPLDSAFGTSSRT